jgi:hypothetical protein
MTTSNVLEELIGNVSTLNPLFSTYTERFDKINI